MNQDVDDALIAFKRLIQGRLGFTVGYQPDALEDLDNILIVGCQAAPFPVTWDSA